MCILELSTSLIRRLSLRPTSEDSEPGEQNNSDSFEKENGLEEEKNIDVKDEEQEDDTSISSEKIKINEKEGKKEEAEKKEIEEKKRGPDNQTLLRLLEQGEQLHSMFRCARIQGLETAEGLLLFGKDHYYVVDGFTLLKTREIRDLDFLSQELHDPIVPYQATGCTHPPRTSRLCSKFSYDEIKEVHKRRWVLNCLVNKNPNFKIPPAANCS